MASQAPLDRTRHIREPDLVEAASALFVKHPLERVTLNMLGEASGLERTWVHRWGSREDLYRLASRVWLSSLDDALATKVATNRGMLRYLNEQAEALAEVFQRSTYRNLLHVLMRDADDVPWLVEAYDRRTLELISQIEGRISKAGRHLGVELAAPQDAIVNFVKELEAIFTLRALQPGIQGSIRNVSLATARASSDLHNAVIVIEDADCKSAAK